MRDSSRPVRSIRHRARRALPSALAPFVAPFLALVVGGLVAGCATPDNGSGSAPRPAYGDAGGGVSNAGSGSGSSARTTDGRDLVTSSDKNDADRRADAHMDLAREYFRNAQYETALDEVKQALSARPERADAYSLRGLIYGALREPATAEESFRRALQLRPNDADTLHNYGWFLCQTRRYGEADTQFNLAADIPGYYGVARTRLAQGVCQANAGDLATAERTLARAYELDPANPTTAVNLSIVLYQRGQYERARFYIRRVNGKDEYVSAQTLWLAARIEHKLADEPGVQQLGRQLHERFGQSREALEFDKGHFDD